MAAETWQAGTALACALYGLVIGQAVPTLIARIPEPDPEAEPESEPVPGGLDKLDHPTGELDHPTRELDHPTGEPDHPTGELDGPGDEAEVKELYADIARSRGLRAGSSLAGAVVAGLLGGAVGWSPALMFLLYLVPVGVALAVVDWRTRRLPTRVIAPSYGVVASLAVVAAWAEGDWSRLLGAVLGWVAAGGLFFVLWFIYPKGMGYGDVRLSGVLGIALGYLGWGELIVGLWIGFVLGAVGGLMLAGLRIFSRKAYPFGPFMLVGAVLGVVIGPHVGAWYA